MATSGGERDVATASSDIEGIVCHHETITEQVSASVRWQAQVAVFIVLMPQDMTVSATETHQLWATRDRRRQYSRVRGRQSRQQSIVSIC